MLDGIDHALVAVQDLDIARQRFETLLGRGVSWRGKHQGTGTESAVFALSNTAVELVAAVGEGSLADVVRQQLRRGEGLFALALCTADAAAAVATLRERDLEVDAPGLGEAHDADGNVERRWHSFALAPTDTRGLMVFLLQREGEGAAFETAPPLAKVGTLDAMDHIVVQTSQPDAAIALYRDALGIRLALDRTFDDRQVRLLFFRLGGVTLEVACALAPERRHRGADRLWGFALRCSDIEAAHTRLAASEMEVTAVRDGHKPGTRVFSVVNGVCGIPTLVIEDESRR